MLMRNNWPDFKDSMECSYYFNNEITEVPAWIKLIERYESVKLRKVGEQKIPKILHQIWLGREMSPAQRERCNRNRDVLPADWTYKLWTENEIKEVTTFHNYDIYNHTPNYGQKSDILRLEILQQFGGVYCDTDFIIHKPFDELLDLDFFCGIAYDREPNILNSIIGSSPGNNLINDLLNFDKDISWNDAMAVIDTTGPYFLTRKIFKNIECTDLIVLPNSFLFPFPNFDICKKKGHDYKNYEKEESFCTHLWECSWMS
jgi:mannosyltransferase OCH1-like enzyme